jgi:hypothetical protein
MNLGSKNIIPTTKIKKCYPTRCDEFLDKNAICLSKKETSNEID